MDLNSPACTVMWQWKIGLSSQAAPVKRRKREKKSGKTRLVKAKNANETDDLYSIYDRARQEIWAWNVAIYFRT